MTIKLTHVVDYESATQAIEIALKKLGSHGGITTTNYQVIEMQGLMKCQKLALRALKKLKIEYQMI